MQGKSLADANKQIRVGVSTMGRFWKSAYKYLSGRLSTVPIDDLAFISDLFYVAGPAATKKKLDSIPVPDSANVRSRFPTWNALPHPNRVLSKPFPWDLKKINTWLTTGKDVVIASPKTGYALGLLLLMAAYWLMKGKKNE